MVASHNYYCIQNFLKEYLFGDAKYTHMYLLYWVKIASFRVIICPNALMQSSALPGLPMPPQSPLNPRIGCWPKLMAHERPHATSPIRPIRHHALALQEHGCCATGCGGRSERGHASAVMTRQSWAASGCSPSLNLFFLTREYQTSKSWLHHVLAI